MASIQERLKAKRREALASEIRLPVPGWADDCLIAVYRPVEEWAQVREFMATTNPTRELEVAAATLVRHCLYTEGHIDGEVQRLPQLGQQLASELGIDGAEGDEAALFMLIPTQTELMEHYMLLRRESGALLRGAQEEMRGESPAS